MDSHYYHPDPVYLSDLLRRAAAIMWDRLSGIWPRRRVKAIERRIHNHFRLLGLRVITIHEQASESYDHAVRLVLQDPDTREYFGAFDAWDDADVEEHGFQPFAGYLTRESLEVLT